jgi:hypothetical protein
MTDKDYAEFWLAEFMDKTDSEARYLEVIGQLMDREHEFKRFLQRWGLEMAWNDYLAERGLRK